MLRSNDSVELSLSLVMLREVAIDQAVMDANTSVREGTIGIFWRRVIVLDEDYEEARELLRGPEILDNGNKV